MNDPFHGRASHFLKFDSLCLALSTAGQLSVFAFTEQNPIPELIESLIAESPGIISAVRILQTNCLCPRADKIRSTTADSTINLIAFDNAPEYSASADNKMNSKVVLVLVVFLAVSLVPESQAFTAGGSGNIPSGSWGKREMLSVSTDRPTPLSTVLICTIIARPVKKKNVLWRKSARFRAINR